MFQFTSLIWLHEIEPFQYLLPKVGLHGVISISWPKMVRFRFFHSCSKYRYRLDPVGQIVKRFISNGIIWKKKWIKIYLLSLWTELIQSQVKKIDLADFNRIQVRRTHCHAAKNGFLRLQILKMCKLRLNYPF